ncbi:laforin-like [Pongo pygmaeus]|uniref:laforin-like n=1 Tax=Pongo pygmaeus TaxID=9600 RepID=UPI00300CADAA
MAWLSTHAESRRRGRSVSGGGGGREGAGKAAPPRSGAAAGSHAASSCRGNSCLGARDPRPPTSSRAGDFKRGQRGPAPAASWPAGGTGVAAVAVAASGAGAASPRCSPVAPSVLPAAGDCLALQSPSEEENVCPTDWQGMLRHPVRSLVQGRAGRRSEACPGLDRSASPGSPGLHPVRIHVK